jgi:hypothetical protein
MLKHKNYLQLLQPPKQSFSVFFFLQPVLRNEIWAFLNSSQTWANIGIIHLSNLESSEVAVGSEVVIKFTQIKDIEFI